MKFEDRASGVSWKALLNSYNVGLVKVLRESGFKKFVFATSATEKNCKVCKALNGVELSADEIAEIFPCHLNCSCFVLPKVE